MTRIKVASVVLTISAALITALVILGPTRQGQPDLAAQAARKPRAPAKPISMPTNLVGLEISLGVTDKEATRWDGDIQLSEGKLLEVEVSQGGPKANVMGAKFVARTTVPMQKMAILSPILRANVEAPPSANVTVNTTQGKFSFKLGDLTTGVTKVFLDGKAKVERQDAVVRLTGTGTEDDYPALAKGKDGSAWLAYVEYTPGQPFVKERVLAGGFNSPVPTGNGDQVRLVRFDGATWQVPMDVSDAGLHVWRPTVAVDGKGDVVVAWSQQVDGDYEIFYRRYTPAKEGAGKWSDIVRLTKAPGADFHVVATTDSAGVVWLAWQAWRKDNFEIMLAALADGHPYKEPRIISTSKANDWSPAITADSKGNVYVAYDTYDKGNYDVMLHVAGKEPKTITVAGSPKFEARPSLACDAKDRVWIAYEEGDEQWGKDFSTDQFARIPLEKNPGNALYINRTVQVKCLVDGKLMQTADDLQKALSGRLPRNKSVPRLAIDAGGGVWLTLRHHPRPATPTGEVWYSYAVRYNGATWSAIPRRLPASANLMDNRPALVPFGQGILAVYSGDNRTSTAARDQDDLFASALTPSGSAQDMKLIDDAPAAAAKLPPVHKDETADVARMRNARVELAGKQLHFLRGEFHRHTEYSAHRDADGLMEDAWRYGLDCAAMDWIGVGDHDNGSQHEYMWWHFQKMTDLHNHAPQFVGIYTYERSVNYPNGHRNILFAKPGIRPLPRGELPGTADKGSPDTKLLYAYLKHFGGICASHTSGTNMGTDWRDNDPTVEPIVEIYQGHRHNYEEPNAPRHPTQETNIGGYQPAGYIWNAFEKGYRFGFQASSDHMSTHMSYGVVLTDDISRQGLIDAFKKRHSYGATDNILVDVRSGDHIMGDEFETSQRPTLTINVHGTGPIAKVHIIRNNKYVYTTEPKNAVVKDLRYTDMDAPAGKTSYYYVRVEQADGNLAWASPMWIMYKP